MNIKVITRHGPSNYGSLLQSIATIKVLEKLGHNAQIIDYQRKDERGLQMVLTQLRMKNRFSSPVKKIMYLFLRYPVEKLAQIRFDRMRKRWLKMTDRCSNYNELKKIHADIYMTGSDQVWGPTMSGKYDQAYFLDFVKNERKISYAGSFGKIKFDDSIEAEFQRMLSSYDSIAVREDSAVQMLKKWGLNNCAGQVLDPTLLLTSREWCDEFVTSRIKKKNEGQKYILLYLIHNYPEHSAYAMEFAKTHRMRMFRVNPFFHQARSGGKFVYCPDVSEFLSLIKNATYMLTDSFHGTCFAINMNVQFVELLPLNATSARNQSILKLTGLTDRIVKDYNDYSMVDNAIDFRRVNEIIMCERKKSMDTLISMLDEQKV